MERVKWIDKIKITVVLEKVGEERIMLELIERRKRNWQKKISDDRQHYDKWTV